MNFMGLIKRGDKVDKAFEELQSDMAEALDESLFDLDDLTPAKSDSASEEAPAGVSEELPEERSEALSEENVLRGAADLQPEGETPAELLQEPAEIVEDIPETARRLTSHTQSRLAALNSFDELYHDAQQHLQEINAKLSEVATSHHLTREFFNILHADIHRANELELANVALAAEHRKLAEQLHDANRKRQERENAVEILHHRETSLVQEKEALRAALAAAKLEAVEASSAIARNEAELGDLVKTLSARTMEAERRLRENEVLREKHVNLSIDLDKALKREAEARRKLDETSTIHSSEAARHSELVGLMGNSEKEVLRLQKALDIAQVRQSEMMEAARTMEADREAETTRSLAEMRGLRSEIQALQSRLERSSSEHGEAASEIAKLKVQLSDAVAEKHVADERLAALVKENENDKMNLSAASANISQLSLQQASEQMQLDIHKQECEDLRAEIASLNAQIKQLLPYERLYRVTKAKQRDAGSGAAEGSGAAAETTRAASRRAAGAGRRRAM
jgi:chromosome segregation ATPase